MVFAIVLGLVGTAIIFAAGYLTGSTDSGATGSTAATIDRDAGGPGTACDILCRIWNLRRADACGAMVASARAASLLEAANAKLVSAVATAALLFAASCAAQAIPFIGPALAGPLFAAYAVAQFAVIYLAGAAAGAASVAANAATEVPKALAEVAKTEAALKEGCTDPTALAKCLATPSPCAGVP